MKLLWLSDYQHQQLKFCRLHFVDADSPEPLDELLKVFHDPYQANAQIIDALLFTTTLWNVDTGDKGLPPAGTIVYINSYSNLGLFRDFQCPATVSLTSLAWS
ncbi:hypothetical protein PHMEG_00032526 [Phytophthora megakarya]|uniref:Uncharacterized protein n=1 Tax=Phytophthora megakarya TaxID=4795 RepID=A0A225UW71_9STRA|nr:hypothetical protein PHMEG_00032526 [Phytophthora megakarya]